MKSLHVTSVDFGERPLKLSVYFELLMWVHVCLCVFSAELGS